MKNAAIGSADAAMGPAEKGSTDRVLIVAPFGRDGAVIWGILEAAGFACSVGLDAPDLATLLNDADVAVVAEEVLRDARQSAAIQAWITAQPLWSDFPFIVLTGRGGSDPAPARTTVLADILGNVTLLERPLHPVTLTSAVRSAVRARRRQRVAAEVLGARERAEAALRESEARYRTLAETLPQLVWTCLPDGRCDYLSRQWIEYTGTPGPDQLDLRWLDQVIHPEDRERTYRHWMGAVAGLNPYDIEYRIRRRDGIYRWFKARGTAIRDTAGTIVHWFGTCTDIQDIVEARETLARGRAELEHLVEERTRERDRIFELSQDLFAIAGFDGFLKVINPAWEHLLERSHEELLARPFVELIHPDDHERAGAVVAALSQGEITYRFENRLLRADGMAIWISWTAVPEGDVFYAVGRDVTAEKENQIALIAANERLNNEISERKRAEAALVQAQKMEAVGQLTGGIAHDFNNLLTVISGGLGLLDRNPDPARRERLMRGMRQAVERGSGLTSQLLAFSRRQALRPAVIDLAAQINGMSELLDRSLREDIAIVVEFGQGLWNIEADPGQLELVVLNLAVNARDAMPNGGVLTVSVENAPSLRLDGVSGDFVRISISDNGSGMDPEVLPRVFDPFFTTKEVGHGTGLGLAQVYGFVQQSGGAVRIESTLGEGTTVSLYLPRSEKIPHGAAAAPDDHHPPEEAQARGTVLIVEDDENVAALVTDMVEQLGYRVTRVGTAAAALGALANGRVVDVVFSDVIMPGSMNGLDLVREIRRRRPELPVVLTTGFNAGVEADAEENIPVLRKPYEIGQLAATLGAAIGAARH